MNKAFHRAKTRNKYRMDAATVGMSTKSYMVAKFPSLGWGYMVEVIRRRCKVNNVECTITPAQLKAQYEKQQGLCPITGWKLEPKKSGSGLCPETMTVDRKIPSLGYIKTNIQLVCFAANNAKYIWSIDQLLRLCRSILENDWRK